LGVCAVLGLASSACVHPEPPTVGMSKVEANLVFGIDAVPEPVQTPVEQVVAQYAPPPPAADDEVAVEEAPAPSFDFNAGPKVPLLRPAVTSERKAECAAAPITAAAEVPPQPRISGDVLTGTSKWRLEGFLTERPVGGEATRLDIADAADFPRSIRNVKKISDTRYSFEVVKAGDKLTGSDAVTITTYEVNTAGVFVNPSQGVGTVATPGVGEPERGIVITKIQTVDPQSGQQLNKFEPQVGLLVLPLPVVSGDSYQSTAIDPSTGQTMTLDAVVIGRDRIDACGTLVDGWRVDAKQRSSGGLATAAALTIEYDVSTIFATQYGGIPIFEKYAYAAEDCSLCPFEFRSRLGQFPPDPLPAS
jgi:hypothetical protein